MLFDMKTHEEAHSSVIDKSWNEFNALKIGFDTIKPSEFVFQL